MKRIAPLITLCLFAATAGNLHAANSQTDLNDVLLAATNNPTESIAPLQDMPMGQNDTNDMSLLPEESSATDDDIFGMRTGYLHPYISLEGAYTDNLYNLDDDKTSSFVTTLSPGIWFTLPRKRTIPISIVPHNTAPGGLSLQIKDYEGTDTHQLYALVGTDLLFYSEDSDLNTTDVTLEGMGRYNMASGLSLQLLDRYALSHDDFGVGGATEADQREYQSNFVMGTADWNITEKLRIKGDLSNFYLDYDDSINDFLNRTDNSVDVYAFFNYSLKTSFFIEYKYADVEYDTYTEADNNSNFYYGGVTWKTTEKLSLLFKAGLQQKEFDEQEVGYADSDNFVLDLQAFYRFTEKTQVRLELYRLNEESDSAVATEKEVLGLQVEYLQKATDKITGKINLFYENADYNQLVDQDRTDDTFEFRPAIQYLFKDWLMGELTYSFEMDESSDDLFDYDTNTVFLSLNFSL